ncbi:EAL domain-containing protein [Oceanospirillum sanctuarii]|uniref:EAL domain-containing protein n=1 Tax=Oceanospirillum sanctuarii TaxID=1434821 RepID=UPI000A3C0ADF|nr:EAL domain-containing protein [Oceanospirillum sanctuarii]
MKKSALHKRLSYRQAKFTVIVALVLGLVFSGIQIAIDISHSREGMNDKVQQVIHLVEESAVQAAYNIDKDLAERVVKGLINHAYIHYAQIRLDDNSVLATSDAPSIGGGMMSQIMEEERRSYAVPLITVFEEAPVGTLIVETDPDALSEDIFDRAIVILTTGFLRNVLLAICLFFVFHTLISRPLTRLSDSLILLKDNHNSNKQIPALKGHTDDELGFLVDSFNELWSSRNKAEEALRSSEQFNRDVMNSISDMLIICETDFKIYDANHKAFQTLGFDKKDLVGLNMEQLFNASKLPHTLASLASSDDLMHEVSLESELKGHNGQQIPVEIKARSIDLSGKTYILALSRDISLRKAQEARIHHLAYFDSLTDLPNRSLFLDRLHQVQSKSMRHNMFSALLFLDLDRFKNINDSLGHDVGDELLVVVASRLKEMMREEDTVARLGGDEFVVILPELAEDQEPAALNAQRITTRILEVMAKPFHIGQHVLHISASVGIRLFPDDDNDIKNIVKQADTALYRAKSNGKNTFHFYRPSMQLLADQHLAMERALHTALENNELYLHYQPQVDHNFSIIGTEALIRWQHPERGFVPPDQFIGLAEETGLIIPIGRWVLEQACSQLAQWQNDGFCPENFRMAVNISAKQFDHPQFLNVLSEVIDNTGVDPNKLELELTESLLVKNMDATITRMDAIRAMGIALSIDDFGTGYSSLKYLKQMPINQLKIDKSFVMDLLTDSNDRAITETIIAMASHLQMEIIAEGVEDAAIMDLLVKLGCKHFQGYYFSRPVSADNCSQLLQVQKLPLGS